MAPPPHPWCLLDPARYLGGSGSAAVPPCFVRQLPDDLPALRPFYSAYELRANPILQTYWMEEHMWLGLAIAAGYLAFCYVGPLVMAGRSAIAPKRILMAWNLLLAVFSAVGFLRTAPHLLYYASKHGLYASVCAPAETMMGTGACGLWTYLFILSKVPELLDTVFLVLAKKPVIFLHWYHHFTVLLYCWHAYATRSSTGLYFTAMNYGVHALMYYYFALTAMGYKPWWSGVVTTLQISQMFVGVAVCAAVYYFRDMQGLSCHVAQDNFIAAVAMYISYAVLFCAFAVERYCRPAKKGEGKKVAAKGVKAA